MMQLKMKTPEGDGGSVLLEGKLPLEKGYIKTDENMRHQLAVVLLYLYWHLFCDLPPDLVRFICSFQYSRFH